MSALRDPCLPVILNLPPSTKPKHLSLGQASQGVRKDRLTGCWWRVENVVLRKESMFPAALLCAQLWARSPPSPAVTIVLEKCCNTERASNLSEDTQQMRPLVRSLAPHPPCPPGSWSSATEHTPSCIFPKAMSTWWTQEVRTWECAFQGHRLGWEEVRAPAGKDRGSEGQAQGFLAQLRAPGFETTHSQTSRSSDFQSPTPPWYLI